jgi:hypothetical protein
MRNDANVKSRLTKGVIEVQLPWFGRYFNPVQDAKGHVCQTHCPSYPMDNTRSESCRARGPTKTGGPQFFSVLREFTELLYGR